MKMNLSVVMQTVDKMSAPLKKITSNQNKFTKKINETQQTLKNNAGILATISDYRKMAKTAGETGDKLNTAREKLARLNQKIKDSKAPTQTQIEQLKKQREKVKDLNTTYKAYGKELSKMQGQLKSAKVDVSRLKQEEGRLNKEHEVSIEKLNKLESRYKVFKRIANGLNKTHNFIKMPNMNQIRAAGIGIAGLGASIGGYFGIINSTANEMDRLSKTAQNLKMPIDELQAMQSQAEHAGVGADTMSNAMIRFTKRFGVLQTTGTGALGSFLKKGKSPLYGELKRAKSTKEAYGLLLESFSKLKTNQQQMAFADAAFGQDGRRMLLMLRQGTEGLTAARKEFNDLGGGVKQKDADAAEAYDDALQKVQEAMRSIKFAALAPVMRELAKIFTEFTEKFKNANWRTQTLEKVKAVIKDIFDAFKWLGNAFVFITQNLPELIAGFAAFKFIMIGINAVLLANPFGIIIAALGLVATGIAYVLQQSGNLTPVLEALGAAFKRIGLGIIGFGGEAIRLLMLIPRGIMKILSVIPNKLLPDGWGKSIKSAQADLEGLDKKFADFNDKSIKYALVGEQKQTQEKLKPIQQEVQMARKKDALNTIKSGDNQQINAHSTNMLKSPAVQSKSQVDVRIHSDKPVSITKVQSDKNTELGVQTGGLFEFGV